MSEATVLLERSGGVARLTMNRPDAANAMSLAFASQFRAAVAEADADPGCHVLLLRGNGRFFSAGGDVAEMAAAENPSAYLLELAGTMSAGVLDLARSRLLVIAVVHGPAAGAGLGLVLNADIVLAGESATFIAAYSGMGLTPDCGVSHLLPRAVGPRRAIELCLGGRVLTAADARAWGLVSEVHPDADLAAVAEARALELAGGATQAIGPTKLLLTAAALSDYAEALARESESISAIAAHPDTRARIAAFVQRSAAKRP